MPDFGIIEEAGNPKDNWRSDCFYELSTSISKISRITALMKTNLLSLPT